MITRLGSYWSRIAPILGIDVIAPFSLHLPDGRNVEFDALIRNFGFTNGMLLVDDFERIEPLTDVILEMGFGFSTLSTPDDLEEHAPEGFQEMLLDWGWCGPPSKKPKWITD